MGWLSSDAPDTSGINAAALANANLSKEQMDFVRGVYADGATDRADASAQAKRTAALPDVPSIAEAGVPGYEATQWFGMLAPAGTPRPIIDRLNHEMVKLLKSPEVRDRLIADGTDPAPTTPEEFGAYIKSETEKWTKVIKAAGIKPQ